MHRIRWTAVISIATFAMLGVACSGDEASTEATPTSAASAAPKAATSAPTAAATASTAAPPLTTPGADGTVKAVINGFQLPTLAVKAGTVVEVSNRDTTAHTATSDDGKTINSGSLDPNATYKFTASAVGSFPYMCQIHPSMTATITVQ